MPESRLTAVDEAATAALGRRLAALARPGDALLLSGPLGAGKSTLARAFIRAACADPYLQVPSPSFTLVQCYEAAAAPIWHYDLWRVAGPAALAELAWEEALTGIVLVEWPDRLGTLAPPDALIIDISPTLDGREIVLRGEQRWLDAS